MAAFDPGRLRHRVAIERPVPAADGMAVAWQPVATVWTRLVPARADERGVAEHLAGVISHDVTMRWRGDLAGGMRIVHRGRHFRVLAVYDPDELQRYLIARTEEETP